MSWRTPIVLDNPRSPFVTVHLQVIRLCRRHTLTNFVQLCVYSLKWLKGPLAPIMGVLKDGHKILRKRDGHCRQNTVYVTKDAKKR